MSVQSQPLVSIITPTYNHQRFIGSCIESVITQSYPHWEMIIVDDGSTDGTWDIVQSYAARDRRVRAFRQENRGIWRLAETYNFALAQSSGELIAVLEGDDVWLRDKLAVQVPLHREGNYALSFGEIQRIDAAGRLLPGPRLPDVRRAGFLQKITGAHLLDHLIQGDYFIPALTVLISIEHLRRIGGFQQPAYLPLVDYPTWLMIGATGGTFRFIPHLMGHWRITEGQTTWLLAHEIAFGTWRFAQEVSATRNRAGQAPGHIHERTLLSRNRRNFLADSCYRSAAIAFERGDPRAWTYCRELALLGRPGMFAKCLSMFAWKAMRRIVRTAPRMA